MSLLNICPKHDNSLSTCLGHLEIYQIRVYNKEFILCDLKLKTSVFYTKEKVKFYWDNKEL